LRVEPALSVEPQPGDLDFTQWRHFRSSRYGHRHCRRQAEAHFRGISAGRWHHQSQIRRHGLACQSAEKSPDDLAGKQLVSHPSQGSTFTLYPPQTQESRGWEEGGVAWDRLICINSWQSEESPYSLLYSSLALTPTPHPHGLDRGSDPARRAGF